MPALSLAGRVLQCKGVDTVSSLDRILSVGFAPSQGVLDRLEGCGGGELVCTRRGLSAKVLQRVGHQRFERIPFARDMTAPDVSYYTLECDREYCEPK